MKRLHVHVGVDDLATSITFYSTLFAAPPTVVEADYAKWMLDDPRVNFAISAGHAGRGIEHLGIQAEDAEELAEMAARLAQAEGPVLDEGATTCCYAQSTKAWISDPQGVVWETFLTSGVTSDYGNAPALARLASSAHAAVGACCAPALAPAPATGCCG
ncbi:ArsI/CadI family heavy metal resistance metalloenzyme [Sandarakinorhabdus sp. DWP1-3-1]|uniref:ArsI/CadI family heavy metal resistance metalloenzyme n=1 Tax=Sandarakinorhabdus sp. DWP1-3-1 TaxID=2804627 RepID=UPI003CEC1975